ncbi:hypothetical protein [Aquimarina agarilytica]|uniref:hypothetical protein n=1 Tax=Aquimarina agarilytica TaxID=1087449 RepID=UPI0002896E4D|nr:hypothetical protein [Aquimarina agarilytica]
MKLEQKRGGNKKVFELRNNNELFIKEKTLSGIEEWSLYIEEIGNRKFVKIHSRKMLNVIGFIFVFISVLFFLGIFFAKEGEINNVVWVLGFLFSLAMGFVCFKAPMDDKLILEGGKRDVHFFLDVPSRNEVEKFADVLLYKSKEKIIWLYSRIDSEIPEQQYIDQLSWLLNNRYIDEIEYTKKKEAYKTSKLL